MSPRSRLRSALIASALAFPFVAGCDIDTHKTATGTKEAPAETRGPTDPGQVNAGGPGIAHPDPK